MSGGWQSVCTRTRDPKMQQQGCFSVAGILLSVWNSKASNGLNWERVHVRILWHWDVSSSGMPGFYLIFSLFLNELCPVCCTRQRMLVLCSLQVGCSVLCSLPWNSAPKSLCVYRMSNIPSMYVSVALGKSRQNKYSCISFTHQSPRGGISMGLHFSCRKLTWAFRGCRPQELLLFNLPLIDE